jgi:adenylyl cyclase-associated protein
LKVAASCQKPDQKTLEGLLSPFPQSMEAISRAKEANRRDRDWHSHLTVVAEGAPVIGWVVNVRLSADSLPDYDLIMFQPKPVQAVIDIKDSVVYYGNKLKKEYKDKYVRHAPQSFHPLTTSFRDTKHLKWVDSYVAILDALQAYVKEYHTIGLAWNPKVCFPNLPFL